MSLWVAVVVAGAGSFALRCIAVVVLGSVELPGVFERMLRHAGTAALSGLLASHLVHDTTGSGAVTTGSALAGVAVSAVVAVRRRSPALAVAAGLGVYGAGWLAVSFFA